MRLGTPPPHNSVTLLGPGDQLTHIHYKLWYLFLYLVIFHSKSVTMLVLCLVLAKIYFRQFLLSVFKLNDAVNFEDNFFVQFKWLSNQNFPFKVCNTYCIIPGFDKQFIFKNIYSVI